METARKSFITSDMLKSSMIESFKKNLIQYI